MITLKSAHEIQADAPGGKNYRGCPRSGRGNGKARRNNPADRQGSVPLYPKPGASPLLPALRRAIPVSVCVSVNDEIIHGIPGPRVLQEGDIVSVDVGATSAAIHGDCAATYPAARCPTKPCALSA